MSVRADPSSVIHSVQDEVASMQGAAQPGDEVAARPAIVKKAVRLQRNMRQRINV
ncbi:MAG TPA: hypothetical protein VKE51_24985 [Vicinamibacterales bacterium]|nr:hypothetical protein [Vicinamibacterales bacterium]